MKLRKATFDDAELLYAIRTDPQTMDNSFEKEAFSLEQHCEWLKPALAMPSRSIYVFENEACEPVGMGRSDLISGLNELSWAVHPKHRGKGYGSNLVSQLCRLHSPSVAKVLKINKGSIRLAEKAGMVLYKESDNFVIYKFGEIASE